MLAYQNNHSICSLTNKTLIKQNTLNLVYLYPIRFNPETLTFNKIKYVYLTIIEITQYRSHYSWKKLFNSLLADIKPENSHRIFINSYKKSFSLVLSTLSINFLICV